MLATTQYTMFTKGREFTMKQIFQWGFFLGLSLLSSTVFAAGLPPTVGFQGSLTANQAVKKAGWVQVINFKTGVVGQFSNGSAFDAAKGVFTAPEDGYYLLTAIVRFDNANNGNSSHWVRSYISINGSKDLNNGLHSIEGAPKDGSFTLPIEGVVKLSKNDKVTLWAYSQGDTDYTVTITTSFGGMFLGKTLTHGFHAAIQTKQTVTAKGWQQVTAPWKTSGTTGLFMVGTGFDANKGEFVVPVTGTYYLSARLRVDGASGGVFQAHIATGKRDPKNGLIFTARNSSSPYSTLRLGGVVQLTKGDKVSLWMNATTDTNYIVQVESGFTGVLLSTNSRLGSHAVKKGNFSLLAGHGFYLARDWEVSGATGLYDTDKTFQTATGEFIAGRSGYYYVAGQARISWTGSVTNNHYVGVDVKKALNVYLGTFAHTYRATSKDFSVHFNGIVFAKKGEAIRFLGYHNGPAFVVQAESSFSVAMVGFLDEDKDGVSTELDCNDNDSTVSPLLPEKCDSIDRDCSGKPRDIPGSCTVPGVKSTCAPGVWACTVDEQKYCKQLVFSQIETCSGKDDNCDGVIDNVPGLGGACQDPSKKGACGEGVWQCVSNQKTCVTKQKPTPEVCDEKDNDCDGKVDNLPDLGKACTDSQRKGLCTPGTWLCAGKQKICQPLQTPRTETCDGKDEDCDGQVDNIPQAGQPCNDTTRLGECKVGTWTCQGTAKVCKATNQPGTEVCDGKDNDCDGKIDNVVDLGKACSDNTRKGPCQPGVWACLNNAKVCQATVQPSAEICDQKDNDCDGVVDNGVCNKEPPPDGGNPDPVGCGQGCPPGQLCLNNTCKPHPCEGITCKEGEFCRDGQCVSACGCMTCPAGNVCIDGKCHADVCAGVTCPKGEVCSPDSGQCVADSCLGKTCADGEVCQGGTCVQDPCLLVTCGTNQSCINGQCFDKGCEPGTKRTTVDTTLPAGPPPISGAGCSIQPINNPPTVPFLFGLALVLLVAFRRRR